ncbi:MAG TPA: SMP-30/gluconolactonase/LRE family protein [Pseudonocardia sp.]|jgi:gluconolactonase|nr:SMP-30/gluconolactonase/LRE family protein [Pseudonocardia sp.]
MSELETLLTGYGLIEAPVWDGTGLVFSDVPNGGLHRLGPDGEVTTVVAHRRGIGGAALHADGGYVISGRNVAWKSGDSTAVLFAGDPTKPPKGFNDLTTDPLGRIYVGSLELDPFSEERDENPGCLYRIDLDGTATVLADDVLLTNGLGVSPDGRALYHSDSLRGVVWRYTMDGDGEVTGREAFLDVGDQVPDGLAVAQDGSVWVALAHSGAVAVVEPDGTRRPDLPCPVPMVTSVCFGGADLTDLYVVTGPDGAPAGLGGTVLRARGVGPGLPVLPAQVQPQS